MCMMMIEVNILIDYIIRVCVLMDVLGFIIDQQFNLIGDQIYFLI